MKSGGKILERRPQPSRNLYMLGRLLETRRIHVGT
jgi:hypothetical protein